MYTDPPTTPGSYDRPSAPMCLSGYQFSGEHDCSEWELNDYIDEVNDYIRKISTYAQEAQRFAQDAETFADEAFAYAECEAEEAKDPLD